ncbi:MAG TPA: hypothetical protein VHF89_08310 [Solirubrobacteraceae bacterium]|nr:hypothetical protein [Solirubrobacteraceae bacterium]
MITSAPRPDPVTPFVQRLVAASGILFSVLLVVALALTVREPPAGDEPVAEWTQFARDAEDEMRLGALALGLATYVFVLFLGYLRTAIAEAEERARGFSRGASMVLIGGTLGIVGLSLFVYLAALSVQEPETPPETIRALNDLSGAGLGLGAGGFGACLVTVALVNLAVRALPAWLGWVALGAGLAFVLQFGVLLSDDGDESFFGVFFPIAFLLLVVFAAGASLTFLRDQRAGAA